MTTRKLDNEQPAFARLLKGLAQVPIEELRDEERKYEAAKRRRQKKVSKRKR